MLGREVLKLSGASGSFSKDHCEGHYIFWLNYVNRRLGLVLAAARQALGGGCLPRTTR